MVGVQVSRDPGSGLVAVGLGAEHPAALPRAVWVLDAILGELVPGGGVWVVDETGSINVSQRWIQGWYGKLPGGQWPRRR